MSKTDTRTVKIRARLLMNAKGKWAIYGWNDAEEGDCDSVLYDMMADDETDSARSFWITAEVPLPQAAEIKGEVE